jgi:hypothetical protein
MEVKNRMGHRAAAVKALLADMVGPTKEVSH